MTITTRSGRVSIKPERFDPKEDICDDYSDSEEDDEEYSDDEDLCETDDEDEDEDCDDADENGNLRGFVVDDEEEDA